MHCFFREQDGYTRVCEVSELRPFMVYSVYIDIHTPNPSGPVISHSSNRLQFETVLLSNKISSYQKNYENLRKSDFLNNSSQTIFFTDYWQNNISCLPVLPLLLYKG